MGWFKNYQDRVTRLLGTVLLLVALEVPAQVLPGQEFYPTDS